MDVVRLDVSVLDGDGRPVRGLTAGDFTIRDNGRTYTPSFFEAIEIPLVLETGASWRNEVASDVTSNEISDETRLVAIVIDNAALPGREPRTIEEHRQIARSVIAQLAPSDRAAVVFSLHADGSQNFTHDKTELLRAVDRMRSGFVSGAGTVSEEHFMRSSIRTLQYVAEILMEAPARRKALVYVSFGVPVTYGEVQTAVLGAPSGVFNDILRLDMEDVFARAQRANVTVYAFSPEGLLGYPRPPRAEERLDYLRTMAANTGGFAVVNTNEPANEVPRVFEENSAYYLIGYEPVDPPQPGGFRTVDVEVDRPDVRVRTRRGYYTPEEEDDERAALTPEERTLQDAISGLLPVSAMPMRAQVAPFPVPGADDTALVIVAELRRPPPDELTEYTIRLIISAYDDRGRRQADKEQPLTIFMEPGERAVRVEVLSRLDLEPGRYEIRLASHNPEIDLSGSVFQTVDVPDFTHDGVRLSGVLIETPSATFTGPVVPPDEVSDLVPVVPTTVREFPRGSRATVFARVHQGGRRGLEDVDINVTILAADGRPVIDRTGTLAATQFAEDRQTDLRMELPLPAFEPGEYLLTIALVGSEEEAATRQVRFKVR